MFLCVLRVLCGKSSPASKYQCGRPLKHRGTPSTQILRFQQFSVFSVLACICCVGVNSGRNWQKRATATRFCRYFGGYTSNLQRRWKTLSDDHSLDISSFSGPFSIRKQAASCLTAILVVLVFTLPNLMIGWFPHDEGQLGQAAERFLSGELPHRDFDDMYTGLLTVLHAAAFSVFGISTQSTRWMLLGGFVLSLFSVYRVARRWTTSGGAFLTTVLVGIWSVPLNPESMPSWYILFLAIGLLDVLLLFLETGEYRWLFVAGLLAGLSVLFKITGIYLVAAGVLFLIWHEQRLCRPEAMRSVAFSLWNTFCLLIYVAAASRIWSPQDPLMSALHLTIPAVLPGLLAIRGEWQYGRGTASERFWRWLRLQLSFIAGVLLPLMIWVCWYWSEAAIGALYEGLIVLPRRRLEFAGAAFPGISELLLSATVFITMFVLPLSARTGLATAAASSRKSLAGLVVGCALLLVAGCLWTRASVLLFQMVRNLIPCAAAGLLWRAATNVESKGCVSGDSGRFYLMATVTVMGSLVQFPFALDTYFLYAAPLMFLSLQLLAAALPATGQKRCAVFAVMLCLFAVLKLKAAVPLGAVTGAAHADAVQQLAIERCRGLRVERSLGDVYARLVPEIQRRTAPGEAILAGPDCPEIYFLAARRNPTRVFYDFFRPEFLQDRAGLDAIADREQIRLVVVKQPVLREFTRDAGIFEEWARERFPESVAFHFAGQSAGTDSAVFIVYSQKSNMNPGDLKGPAR